jgi:hypothetical protein
MLKESLHWFQLLLNLEIRDKEELGSGKVMYEFYGVNDLCLREISVACLAV